MSNAWRNEFQTNLKSMDTNCSFNLLWSGNLNKAIKISLSDHCCPSPNIGQQRVSHPSTTCVSLIPSTASSPCWPCATEFSPSNLCTGPRLKLIVFGATSCLTNIWQPWEVCNEGIKVNWHYYCSSLYLQVSLMSEERSRQIVWAD